jgi:hypothetical protein
VSGPAHRCLPMLSSSCDASGIGSNNHATRMTRTTTFWIAAVAGPVSLDHFRLTLSSRCGAVEVMTMTMITAAVATDRVMGSGMRSGRIAATEDSARSA